MNYNKKDQLFELKSKTYALLDECKRIILINSNNMKTIIIDNKYEDISDTNNSDKIEKLMVNNEGETKELIICDLLKKAGNVLEKSMIENNEELVNNSLKTINNLATIISLKEQSRIANNFEKSNQLSTVEKLSKTNEMLNNESTFVPLAKWLKDLKCVIKPLNNHEGNNKSFQYSVALSKHKEIGVNYNRINKIEPFLKNFNFKNIFY